MKCISVLSFLCCVLCFLLAPLCNINAQNQTDMDSLLHQSALLQYENPDKSLLIDDYILKESTTLSTKVNALVLQSQAYLIKQEYTNALSKIQQAYDLKGLDKRDQQILLFNAGLIYHDLELSKQAEELLKSAKNSSSENNHLNILLFLSKAQDATISREKQLNYLNSAKKLLKTVSSRENRFLEKKYELVLAEYLIKNKQYDSAAVHLKRLSNWSALSSGKDIYYFLSINKLGEIAQLQNNPEEAKSLLEMNIFETKFGDKIFIRNYQLLSQIYYKENNFEKFALYQKKYIDALESQTADLQGARVNAAKFYGTIKNNVLSTNRANFQSALMIICIISVGIIAFLLLYYFKTVRKYKNQFLILKNKNELENKINEIEQRVAKENAAIPYTIPEKTELAILEKLAIFEKSLVFTDSSLSIQSLAEKLNTNTKYLSDIINNKKNKNFKTYINELRIEYIKQKLKNDPSYLNYKTSYLAKESGFTSRSSFTVIFKNIVGIPPSVFIENLRNEKR